VQQLVDGAPLPAAADHRRLLQCVAVGRHARAGERRRRRDEQPLGVGDQVERRVEAVDRRQDQGEVELAGLDPAAQDLVERAGGKVGKYTIKYVSLDDATPAEGKWEAGQVSSNARTAAQNKNTILYLGEFNSGATAVSLPILNRSGIRQISPSNTAVGLTKKSADAAEPAKYYPTGKRTYGRVVPADNIQAAAQVTYMKDGKGVGDAVAADAKKSGIQVLDDEGVDPKAANYRSLAQKIKPRAPTACSSVGSPPTTPFSCGATCTPPTPR
jgi:ABC-type branched-subunit amino acid transport system substrate-binding protein